MYVLVHERVLHDDDEFQLAHAYWIVQVPDVRWRSNSDAHANTYADSNSDSDAYTDTDSNADSNACAVAECANEFSCESGIYVAGQLVVDGQLE